MFLTIENIISVLTIFGAVVAFIFYRAGRSDQRDSDQRARLTEAANRQLNAVRGNNGH